MATLDDVAQLAGVSKATASRALARPELVRPETIGRVRQAAETLGFEPSRIARALARGRTGLVAMVVPNLENSFFAPIIEGAQRQAEAAGYHLTIAVRGLDSPDDQSAMERLAQQVDGFLLVAPQAHEEVIRRVSALAPTVLLEREVDGIPSVIADTPTAFASLAADFVARGHRSIAYIGGPANSWPNRMRTEAIVEALRGRAELSVFGPFAPLAESGFAVTDAIVASGATAAIVYAAPISLGLMFALGARTAGHTDATMGDVPIVVSGDARMAKAMGIAGIPTIDV
ncbi:MAG: putative transcriptional regulator, partial [Glaciihabitans sp.]|nr:putative transcriptional regulator [Glaciihabitans sp.]